VKQSERLAALLMRLSEELTEDEAMTIKNAIQTSTRLEHGEGFIATAVVSQSNGSPRVDCCWMGMLAQVSPAQARGIASTLYEAASEAESDAAVVQFCRDGLGFEPYQAASTLLMIRATRDKQRQPVVADVQEPRSLETLPPVGSKPS
jgi:hypothetical protein